MSELSDLDFSDESLPSTEEMEEIDHIYEAMRAERKSEAQAKEKIPVTAQDLHRVLTSVEFIDRIQGCINSQIKKAKPDGIDIILASLLPDSPSDFGRESGFKVHREYDTSIFHFTDQQTGDINSFSPSDFETIGDTTIFELINFHHEPIHPDNLGKHLPIPSIIFEDAYGLRGDLWALSRVRQDHIDDFGVEIHPVMVVLQGANGAGRVLFIQESGEIHEQDSLHTLKREVSQVIKKGASKEDIIQTVRGGGYNFFMIPFDKTLSELTVQALEPFASTPSNLL